MGLVSDAGALARCVTLIFEIIRHSRPRNFLWILAVFTEVVEEESEFSDYMKEICEKVTPGPKTVKVVRT